MSSKSITLVFCVLIVTVFGYIAYRDVVRTSQNLQEQETQVDSLSNKKQELDQKIDTTVEKTQQNQVEVEKLEQQKQQLELERQKLESELQANAVRQNGLC